MAYALPFALYELYFVIHSALLILQRINASSSSSSSAGSRGRSRSDVSTRHSKRRVATTQLDSTKVYSPITQTVACDIIL